MDQPPLDGPPLGVSACRRRHLNEPTVDGCGDELAVDVVLIFNPWPSWFLKPVDANSLTTAMSALMVEVLA